MNDIQNFLVNMCSEMQILILILEEQKWHAYKKVWTIFAVLEGPKCCFCTLVW